MIVAQIDTLLLTQSDTCTVFPFQSTYIHKAFHLLVGTLSTCQVCIAVGKISRQFSCLIGYCTGHILHGHVAIITKLSPHHILTVSTISGPPFLVHEVVMVPGLLLIFLHGCEIKSQLSNLQKTVLLQDKTFLTHSLISSPLN